VIAQRLAAGVEYDGSGFHGWQVQSHARSIQSTLNAAISTVANETLTTGAAGRTDTGVHACGQVVHFDSVARRSEFAWLRGINSNLPADIAIQWVRAVPAHFHARYSALTRTYRYVILNRPVRSALDRHRAWQLRVPIDAAVMQVAASHLIGEHDFSSFRAAGCQSKNPVRRIEALEVVRHGEHVVIEVRANGFLYHMVRNIVGSLVRAGSGEAEPGWLGELLALKDRRVAAPTAPSAGLFLAAVHYPEVFGLPVPSSRLVSSAEWRDR
jgi:tRNA pseudouridine38-40 synthase